MNLNNINKAYFVGIGGIGMSALARMMAHEGIEVAGSDIALSDLTKTLDQEGITVEKGQGMELVPEDTDLVIYTIALQEFDEDFLQALKNSDFQTLTYPEALGLITKDSYTVAVSGTHGKTTTTAMLAEIASASPDIDPSVIVGSLLSGTGSNFITGDDDLFIVEACEYRRSFTNLDPNILVITNVEADHLDYYSGLEDIQDAFREVAQKVPADGYIVCNPHNDTVAPVVDKLDATVIDYTAINGHLELVVPGEHNKQNARAAISAALKLGVSEADGKQALASFSGTWRRQEYIGETEKGAPVYDDYAHHPTEIKATLEGFRDMYPDKTIRAVFQPHLFSRTKRLLEEFAGSFEVADEVIVLPIYAAREKPDGSINSQMLVEKLQAHDNSKSVRCIERFESVVKELAEVGEGEMVIALGAGDVYQIARDLVNHK